MSGKRLYEPFAAFTLPRFALIFNSFCLGAEVGATLRPSLGFPQPAQL